MLQNIDYSYDRVGNITLTENQPFITRDATSRSVVQEYGYDDLHRLTSAVGKYAIGSDHLDRYAGTFAYDSIGNFQTKDQRHWYEDPLTGIQSDRPKTSYSFAYQYQGPQPHAVTNVGGNTYKYDDNGNLALRVDDQTGQTRQILWNEENRITSLLDQGKETVFRYDDGGTRIFKSGKYGETIYVDPNFSIREGEVASKHIFAGSTRIATKMVMKENRTGASKKTYVRPTDTKGHSATVPEKSQGNHGQVDKTLDPVLQEQANGKGWEQRDRKTSSANGKGLGKEKRNANGGDAARETLLPGNSEKGLENALSSGNGSKTGIYKRLDRLGYEVTIDHRIVPRGTDPTDPDDGAPIFTGPTIPEEQQIYYFHGDHLGSSSVITDRFGRNYEHLEYFPYGETWVEETRSERNLPFKFTGKELDPETGLYYFGARYYDPQVSVWVSVDPILGDYIDGKVNGGVYNPSIIGLYSYVTQNPLRFIDPNGLWQTDVHRDKTREWSEAAGFNGKQAELIANADNGVDNEFGSKSYLPVLGDQSYHFNTNNNGNDSRMEKFQYHFDKSVEAGKKANNWRTSEKGIIGWIKNKIANFYETKSLKELGTSLHPLQDVDAHTDGLTQDVMVPKTKLSLMKYHDSPELFNTGPNLADDSKGIVPGSNGTARLAVTQGKTEGVFRAYREAVNQQ